VVGGGIGVAPVFPLARELKEAGNTVISVIGYRSKGHVFWEDKMTSVSDRLVICTNDGSYGRKGFVTDALRDLITQEKIDMVFAIGPAVMMKAVADMTRPRPSRRSSALTLSWSAAWACAAPAGFQSAGRPDSLAWRGRISTRIRSISHSL